jgi:hypothetical protein
MIDFFSGAVTMAHLLIGLFFLRFWRNTRDRLFLFFGVAFALFATNQFAVAAFADSQDQVGYTYILRILGFIAILIAIIDKNASPPRNPPK